MDDAKRTAEYAEKVLDLAQATLSREFFYLHLPLCVIDAVYSIGVRYSAVQRVVDRYCQYSALDPFRHDTNTLPHVNTQESVAQFFQKMQDVGVEHFTNTIFRNRQRTSTRGGILKGEAVYHFAQVLQEFGVNYLQDVSGSISDVRFEQAIRRIPGQTSGIALQYFFMLAGSEQLIKPDRMVLRFLDQALQQTVTPRAATSIVIAAAQILRVKYPHVTPRVLDYTIWNYQRDRKAVL